MLMQSCKDNDEGLRSGIVCQVHLNEELLGRLASPKAASIRRYDGHLNIQRLRETAGVKGC